MMRIQLLTEPLNNQNQERRLLHQIQIVQFGDLIGQDKAQNYGHFQRDKGVGDNVMFHIRCSVI